MAEIRRILLDGYPTEVRRDGDMLIAGDGRSVGIDAATHLAPVEPTKIICIHLNYRSRVDEFMTKLPARTDVLPQADHRADRSWVQCGPARRVRVAQLRGRDCHRYRQDVPQHFAG